MVLARQPSHQSYCGTIKQSGLIKRKEINICYAYLFSYCGLTAFPHTAGANLMWHPCAEELKLGQHQYLLLETPAGPLSAPPPPLPPQSDSARSWHHPHAAAAVLRVKKSMEQLQMADCRPNLQKSALGGLSGVWVRHSADSCRLSLTSLRWSFVKFCRVTSVNIEHNITLQISLFIIRSDWIEPSIANCKCCWKSIV